MRRDELRRAIELPARRAGLHVEPDLVDALVADVDGRPGRCRCSRRRCSSCGSAATAALRLADHEHAGRRRGAVARLAEDAYERLVRERGRSPGASSAPRGRGRGRRRRAAPRGPRRIRRRRRAPTSSRCWPTSALVTIGDGEVEVAHEALLREWPRLREWLREDAEARRLHQHLIRAAQDWQAAGRDPAELYRGARLAAALEWSTSHEAEPNALEREFLDREPGRGRAREPRQRRANRRLRALLGGVAALLVLAVVAGAVAVSQRGQARDAALTADAQRLGAEAQSPATTSTKRCCSRARRGPRRLRRHPRPAALGAVRDPQALGTLAGDGSRCTTCRSVPTGGCSRSRAARARVTFLDTARRRPVGRPYRLRHGLRHRRQVLARRTDARGR